MAEIDAIFNACVTQLMTGAAVEACLVRIPAEAPEVAPLVEIVAALQSLSGPLPEIDAQTRHQARSRFLSHARALAEPSSVTTEEAFDESIGKLAAGASIDECLDAIPHHAAELKLLLTTVADLRNIGNVRAESETSVAMDARQRFVARATLLRTQPEVSIEDALDASVQLIAAGATIETCLELLPMHAVELRTLLEAVLIAQQTGQPAPKRPRNVVLSQRRAFLTAAAALEPAGVAAAAVNRPRVAPPAPSASRRPAQPAAPPSPPWWQSWIMAFRQPAWRVTVAAVMLLVLLLGFGRTAVTVASGSLPGDALYPVKRLTERTRLVLTVNSEQRGELEQELNELRLMEAKQVVTQGRQVPVEIPGVIGFIDGDTWTIVGLDSPVIVPPEAVRLGVPRVGNRILIQAWSDGQGKLVARSVTVLEDEPSLQPSDDTPTPPTRPRATGAPNSGGIPIRPTWLRPTPTQLPWPTATAPAMVTATATLVSSVIGSPTPDVSPTGTPISTDTSTPPSFGTPTTIPEPTGTPTQTLEPPTPTVEPQTPTSEPFTPTVEPQTPTPEPLTPTVDPLTPTPEPPTPTAEPPTPTPEPPTPSPAPSTSTPESPTATLAPSTPTSEPPAPTVEPPTSTSEPPTETPEPPVSTPAASTPTFEPPKMVAGLAESQRNNISWLESVVLRRRPDGPSDCLPVRLMLPQRWLDLCNTQAGYPPVTPPN